jgi:NAD-dependent dihydropyrimidine dehydrogenase PreA subunit
LSEDTTPSPEGQKPDPGLGEFSEHRRLDNAQPISMPGIHRYQFFTNLRSRMTTQNLNRLAMLGIAASAAAVIVKPLLGGNPETIYCYECRACYATQERCPAAITFQAELVVSSRVSDYGRFIRAGGLKCLRCGACRNYCVQYLDTPQIFGTMQQAVRRALAQNIIPRSTLKLALDRGLVGGEFIDEVTQAYQP